MCHILAMWTLRVSGHDEEVAMKLHIRNAIDLEILADIFTDRILRGASEEATLSAFQDFGDTDKERWTLRLRLQERLKHAREALLAHEREGATVH